MLDLDELTAILYDAAESRHACRISLSGEPFPRVVNAYGVARTAQNQIVLVCWQTMGLTKAGSGEGYRNLKLNRLIEIETLDAVFKKRDDFNPQDSQYAEWVFHI